MQRVERARHCLERATRATHYALYSMKKYIEKERKRDVRGNKFRTVKRDGKR